MYDVKCEALTNMDSFNEVLVEEPVSECRDMATSNASLPIAHQSQLVATALYNGH